MPDGAGLPPRRIRRRSPYPAADGAAAVCGLRGRAACRAGAGGTAEAQNTERRKRRWSLQSTHCWGYL
nr:MAG TPA: hypothetical protein [Caudoviricetes sp.]